MIVGWWIGNVKSKVLIGSRVILEGIGVKFGDGDINILVGPRVTFIGINAGVNNCCYWLFMGLVFASIDNLSCWGIGESNSDLKSIHAFDIS